jgi:threonine aldolase
MVYISNSTEIGTIYSRAELEAISETCHRYGLYLYLDGARLGYALTSPENDLDLPTVTNLCDVFYIGGTKQGALFGECVVIVNPELKPDFRYIIKQKGGMFAKGRLLGLQFLTLFENDLYFTIAREANEKALFLRDEFKAAGYDFLIQSPTNQQFPILPDQKLMLLKEKYAYSYWQRIDEENSAVRFCTSWATTWDSVRQLAADVRSL